MEFSFVILLAIFVVFITRWYIQRWKFIKQLERFPGPPPLPVLGNALDLLTTTDIIKSFLRYREEYGGKVLVWVGSSPTLLLVSDYNFLEYLLSSTTILDKSYQYDFLLNWLGTGLLLTNGDAKWRKHRKIITPTFHFQILEQFVDIFQQSSNILITKLKNEVGKSSFNIYPYITLCALDIICESAMGTSIKAQENSDSDYVRSVKVMCKTVMDRSFNPFMHYTIPYVFTETYRKEKKALNILHTYTNSVIEKRKLELENTLEESDKTEDEVGAKKRLAFLDLLLRENMKNKNLSDQDIREEVDTFMFEGHDTTASGISFALFCLAEHQDVQQKVVDELRIIFSEDKSRSVTFRDLQEMKYLESVIKESLRLYPSVPYIARNVREDVQYDGGVLPKGLTLTIDIVGVHRDPKLFREPEKFNPDRFSTENVSSQYPYGYIPFSAGPRNCVGQKYAMLEMKAVISTVLKNYQLLPAVPKHNLELSAETVLLSKNGIYIQIADRVF